MFTDFKIGKNMARVLRTAYDPESKVTIHSGELLDVTEVTAVSVKCLRPNGDFAVITFVPPHGLNLVEPCH